jgi:hypothetical protein
VKWLPASLACLCLACIVLSRKPVATTGISQKLAVARGQIVSSARTNAPHSPRIYDVPLKWPDAATNFHNLDIYESHDLRNWYCIQSNANPGSLMVWWTNEPTYWRVTGR